MRRYGLSVLLLSQLSRALALLHAQDRDVVSEAAESQQIRSPHFT
jgi:hypothetical protein